MQYFHIGVLCYVAAEYALWTSGCFWPGDSISSPYCWLDLLLTCCIFALLPATGKAVRDMTYIENVFICMASPLLIGALCMGKAAEISFFLLLPCRNGCMSAFCLHQYLFCRAVQGRRICALLQRSPRWWRK